MSYCTGQNIEIARGKAIKIPLMEKNLKVSRLFWAKYTKRMESFYFVKIS